VITVSDSETKVLLLCAGSSGEFEKIFGVPKQLLEFGPETLLGRTVRLLRENELRDIDVVSHDSRLQVDGCGFFRPLAYGSALETFLSTQTLWQDRTIVLHGDVFFTEKAMRTVAQCDAELRMFGRLGENALTLGPWSELFAFSFSSGSADMIADHAKKAIELGGVRIWHLYRSMAGFAPEEHKIEERYFHTIMDFTDDFDTPEKYLKAAWRYRHITSPIRLVRLSALAWYQIRRKTARLYGLARNQWLHRFLRVVVGNRLVDRMIELRARRRVRQM